MTVRILQGDCIDVMRTLDAESIDAIVTDPPYGIGFMGKAWDHADIVARAERRAGHAQPPHRDGSARTSPRRALAEEAGAYDLSPTGMRAFHDWTREWAIQALRVLKPGGHLLSFASTRTYHRMTCGIEEAGFEIRDQIGNVIESDTHVQRFMGSLSDEQRQAFASCIDESQFGGMLSWMFGSGFPKSRNLDGDWKGWGTALKPAWEPIVLARKPLSGTVARNVELYGVGALNIDDCRVETGDDLNGGAYSGALRQRGEYTSTDSVDGAVALSRLNRGVGEYTAPAGRWPANVIHDGSDEVLATFPNAPGQIADASTSADARKTQNVYGAMRRGRGEESSADSGNAGAVGFKMRPGARRLDEGSAARFFYCAKTSRAERNMGCSELPDVQGGMVSNTSGQHITRRDGGAPGPTKNGHPTVKPIALMRYLVRLVTPPGGTVLDPFLGSGSTACACVFEGFNCIGIEKDTDNGYIEIAQARVAVAEIERDEQLAEDRARTAQPDMFAEVSNG